MVGENVSTNESRPVIKAIAEGIGKLNNDQAQDLAKFAIEKLKPRALIFDVEDTIFKKELAEVQAARDEYENAARTLERIKLDQTQRTVIPGEKIETWLLIADHYFAAEESGYAE
jgi:hypothetical protein